MKPSHTTPNADTKNVVSQSFNSFQDLGLHVKHVKVQRFNKTRAAAKPDYNRHQNFLYNRAMYGLQVYTDAEIALLAPKKKKYILKVNRTTHQLLNRLKQEKIISISNKVFAAFGKSSLAADVIEASSEVDVKYVTRVSLQKLHISKEQVIDYLINNKVLTKHFRTLTNAK